MSENAQEIARTSTPHLSRSLGMWAIVGLGLGYMTPMTVFDTFGIVSEETNAVVPLAYLFALVAMVFTAISYGRMTRVYPSAGSAYTYASEAIHPNFGFLVGWSSLLDYLLLPMVNAVIGRIYFESFFPAAPSWVFVVVYVAGISALNFFSMKGTSRINGILVVFQVVLIAAFVVQAWLALRNGMGEGTIFTLKPLYHEGVEMSAVVAGATVVCFSFIGFDASRCTASRPRRRTPFRKRSSSHCSSVARSSSLRRGSANPCSRPSRASRSPTTRFPRWR